MNIAKKDVEKRQKFVTKLFKLYPEMNIEKANLKIKKKFGTGMSERKVSELKSFALGKKNGKVEVKRAPANVASAKKAARRAVKVVSARRKNGHVKTNGHTKTNGHLKISDPSVMGAMLALAHAIPKGVVVALTPGHVTINAEPTTRA